MSERDKRQKFEELAEKRVNKAIKQLKLVGNLSNKNNYSFNEDDAQIIIRALTDEIKLLKIRFSQDHHAEKNYKLKSRKT